MREDVGSPFPPGAALVAGGSGGLGATIAKTLGAAGCPVVVGYYSRGDIAGDIADSIRAAGTPAATAMLDLTVEDSVAGALQTAIELAGGLAAAIYAAGTRKHFDFVVKTTDAEWDRVLALEIRGFMTLSRITLPELRRAGGSIVALTTYQANKLEVRGALSSVTKAAIERATLAIAREEGRYGVRANAIRAGWIAAGSTVALLDEQTLARKRKEIPLGRVGKAEELAEAVAFLTSTRASFITGAILTVDGGESL